MSDELNPVFRREFAVSYTDPDANQHTIDVAISMDEATEELFVSMLGTMLADDLTDGRYPKQTLHLYHRFIEQRSKHPPWIDTETTERTYDLELTPWDYHLLTECIGHALSNVLRPEGADRYAELVQLWFDITDQMRDEPLDVQVESVK